MPATNPFATVTLSIAGMTCASCVAHVSKAARSLSGLDDIAVNLTRGRATVTFNPAQTSPDQISARITESGYQAQPESPETKRARITESGYQAQPESPETKRVDQQKQNTKSWLHRAIAGLILWLPVEIAHWTLTLFFPHAHMAHIGLIWISLLTSSLCLIYVGSSFYKSAWNALMHRTTNIDTLIAMGSSVAYFYSLVFFLGGLLKLWIVPTGNQLYFMESSALLALISLGHWLEANAKRSAGSAIRELLSIAPVTALRENDKSTAISGTEEVPVFALQLGDNILIRPGDRVPIDGTVIEGSSSINESMILGPGRPGHRPCPAITMDGFIRPIKPAKILRFLSVLHPHESAVAFVICYRGQLLSVSKLGGLGPLIFRA